MSSDRGKDLGTRIASMILDHFIMVFSSMILAFILILFILGVLFFVFDYQLDERIFPFIFICVPSLVFSIYLNKDALGGRSPAKRILNLMVVDTKTGFAAHPMKTVLRNLTLVLWPIEVVILLFSPQKRLGDQIAGTTVVAFNPNLCRRTTAIELLLSFVLAILFLLPILVLMVRLTVFPGVSI